MTYLERTLCKYTFLFHDTLDDDDNDDGGGGNVVDGNHDDDDVLEKEAACTRLYNNRACMLVFRVYLFFFSFIFS